MGPSQGVAYETNKPLLIASACPCSKVACSFGPACVCHREIPHVTTPQIWIWWKGSKCDWNSTLWWHSRVWANDAYAYAYTCIYVCMCIFNIFMRDLRSARLPKCQKLFQDSSAGPRIPRAKWHDVYKSLHLLVLVFKLPSSTCFQMPSPSRNWKANAVIQQQTGHVQKRGSPKIDGLFGHIRPVTWCIPPKSSKYLPLGLRRLHSSWPMCHPVRSTFSSIPFAEVISFHG